MAEKVNNFLLQGETLIATKERELLPQILGDPKRSYIDCKGWHYGSKGEMIIANILHKLGFRFDKNVPINLPNWLLEELKEKYNWKYKYITLDFMLIELPKTGIEYWGMKDDKYYDWKREVKEYIYNKLEIKLISIEPHEDQDALGLKKRFMEELV